MSGRSGGDGQRVCQVDPVVMGSGVMIWSRYGSST